MAFSVVYGTESFWLFSSSQLYICIGTCLIKAMYSKSSTFLALTSILAILAVLSIAITDMESAAVRKPFPNSGKDSADGNSQIALPNGWDSLTGQKSSSEISSENKSSNIVISENLPPVNLNDDGLPPSSAPNKDSIEQSDSKVVVETPVVVERTAPVASTDLLVKNVNDESLRIAGFTDFVIKPRPFDGKLFDLFDISMLGPLEIVEKNVIENRNGNEANVLKVYEFGLGDKDTTQEVYDYLKAKIKSELGTTVNENNQFGLSSFYINFGAPDDNAFLVVKTRSNVYALSYPKAKYGNKDYFVLVSALLKELI